MTSMLKILDFWAEWCGPCKFMEPLMEELEKELAGRVKIEKINVDENQELAAKYQVMSIPTYVILKDDQEQERIIGATQKENFLKAISKYE
ncbi:thioredoxin [Candidatus Curtissbacteria bacterium]|nr:thioredoxin [Candidatus Curtissbacteria bacterium]